MIGKKRKILALVTVLLSAILSVVGFFVLPSRATVNISFGGQAEYHSKIVVLAVPLMITLVSSIIYGKYDGIFKKETASDDVMEGIKFLAFSVVGILLTLWAIIKNVL